MNLKKSLLAFAISAVLATGFSFAAGAKVEAKVAGCCAKSTAKGETCAHPCCVESAKAGNNCTKCKGAGKMATKK